MNPQHEVLNSSNTKLNAESRCTVGRMTACFDSGQRVEDHFVEIIEMIVIGTGGQLWANRQNRPS